MIKMNKQFIFLNKINAVLTETAVYTSVNPNYHKMGIHVFVQLLIRAPCGGFRGGLEGSLEPPLRPNYFIFVAKFEKILVQV